MSDQPNIILINCDDLGYGDLACYGSDKNKTPYLDRLAAEGMRFTDFYMASAVCSPSRGAMMTGCLPPRIGFSEFEGAGVLFPGHAVGLNPEENTVASQLKQAGYATKLVGKWHCGDQPEFLPTNVGFDEYFGIPYSNDMGRQSNHNPQRFPPLPLLRDTAVDQEQPDQRALTERYTVEAARFIREHQDEPFFLYFAHMHVHVPIFVPRRFLDQSDNGGYGAAVEEIDWSVGVLMATLDQLGLADNTLLVFTSDNGSRARGEGGSNGPCRGHKGQTWEGGFRVPCLMRWPSTIAAGTVNQEVATAMDFLPTFSAITGVPVADDKTIDGKNILPLMTGESDQSPTERFPYYRNKALAAVRVGDWKLHLYRDQDEVLELYNLRHDVGEEQEVSAQHPEVVEELQQIAEQIRQDTGDAARNVDGSNCRPPGRVDDPVTLTSYREDYPYMIAEYDLADMPTMSG